MGGFKNLHAKYPTRAYLSTKEGEETAEKGEAIDIPDLGGLNVEDISKLKPFLKTFRGDLCSLA